jgi:DNA-directed RNA polymerase III subunit RPC3
VKNDTTLKEFRDSFNDLLCDKYIFRCNERSEDPVPIEKPNLTEIYRAPDIELKDIKEMVESGKDCVTDNGSYFTVNFDKFHQSFRDRALIEAIERQIDSNAAECFQFILQLMYNRTDAWAATTNPIAFTEIKHLIEKKSTNIEVVKYITEYISIIEKDVSGFLNKIDDAGQGMYSINMRNALTQITWSIIENVITQKYGSKAARIFRVVRCKKFIEQDDIQREAMIPAKEARQYTYKLMEENFLQTRTIKKSVSGSGPIKPFYLFHVNQQQIVRDLIETCYKALYNSKVRVIQDKEANKRLVEKAMRLQFIVEQLKERGESEETIEDINETLTPPEKELIENTKMRLQRLESSEVMIDEMVFLLQLFVNYQKPVAK